MAADSKNSGHWDSVAEKHAPTINNTISDLEAGDKKKQIQSVGAELLDLLEATGLTYKSMFHHSRVGVASVNREGSMLCADNVHRLLTRFTEKGWNGRESAGALAGEVGEGASADHERKENLRVIEESGGLLPFLLVEDMQIVTIAGSHTSTVLRLIDGAEENQYKTSPENAHLCVNGFLSKQAILETAPSLKRPCAHGMEYTVVRKQVIKRCPMLMRILSESDNAKHENNQRETVYQTMSNLHRRAMDAKANTTEEWNKVVEAASRRFSKEFEQEASCYAAFVKEYSGGADKPILKMIEGYVKTLTCVREIPPEFFRELARVNMPHAGLYIGAMVMATASAPSTFCKGGKARVFNNEDLASLKDSKKNKANVAEALSIMIEMRCMAARVNVADSAPWAKLQGSTFSKLVMHVHNKKSPSREEFSSLKHIAVEHFESFVKEFNVQSIVCPWVYIPIATADKKRGIKDDPTSISGEVRELDCSGTVAASIISKMGCKVGAKMTSKEGDKTGVVAAIGSDGSTVTITLESGEKETIAGSDILMSWDLVTEQAKDRSWAACACALARKSAVLAALVRKRIRLLISGLQMASNMLAHYT